jgi:nucleoside-diphosphate-sugar epimerase
VFGQSDGSDVDETTPARPTGPTAEILAEAERVVLEARGVPARIVRLSGLYGPRRVGVIDRVRQGALAIDPGDDPWMNWCHLEDAASTVLAALDRGAAGRVYHGSDAAPSRRSEVVTWIARRLGIDPPVKAGTHTAGGRRGANRRILSERTRTELQVRLRYPTFREGLDPFLGVGRPE